MVKIVRVNYTIMEDIPEGEQVLAGTFCLNEHPVIILFDSGASHDFISKACTQKHQLTIEYMLTPYMISTSGGKIITRQVVVNPFLNLGGRVYQTCLVVLEGQGIDVILEMNRMRKHKAVLHIAARAVHLEPPAHGSVILKLQPPTSTVSTPHHTAAQNLKGILVACKFPDVFPEDLSGMPLNRDVEFTIELQPGTAPISRWSYKMTPKELVELKVQLNELLGKGYIHLSSSP
jgi:hypothetical protein